MWKIPKGPWISIVILSTVIILVYLPSLKVPFHLDDVSGIINHPSIHVEELSLAELRTAMSNNRPVANLSFGLNFYFGGLNVPGYHVVNVVIHCLTAVLVYIFFMEILSSSASHFALLGGLLWAVHPVQTQAVTYIIQRMTGLATMFFMLSLVLYIQGSKNCGLKRICLFLLAMLAGILGFGSKEIVVTLPLVILLYEFYFRAHFDFSRLKSQLIYWFLFFGLILFLIAAYFNLQQGLIHGFEAIRDIFANDFTEDTFTGLERLLTESRVIMYYLSLLILPLPSRLSLDYDFTISTSLLNPMTTLFSVISILGLIAFALWIAKKYPVISFAMLWFFITLALESTFIKLDIIFEHRLYLPSIGIFLAVTWILMKITQMSLLSPGGIMKGPIGSNTADSGNLKAANSRYQPYLRSLQFKIWRLAGTRMVQTGIVLFTFCILAFYSVATVLRNAVWQDNIGLWLDAEKKSPNKARIHNNLGVLYLRGGQLDLASQEFEQAFRLKPGDLIYRNNLAAIYERQNNLEKAIRLFQEAREIDPFNPLLHQMLGRLYSKSGRLDLAIIALEKSITLDPERAMTYSLLGRVYQKLGYVEKASMAYERTLELIQNDKFKPRISHMLMKRAETPDKPSMHYQLGQIYEELGNLTLSIQHYQKAIEILPVFLPARKRLLALYIKTGSLDLAEREYQKILEEDPSFAIPQENLDPGSPLNKEH